MGQELRIETADQVDLPGRELNAVQPGERIDLEVPDRLGSAPAHAPPAAEPAEHLPDVLEPIGRLPDLAVLGEERIRIDLLGFRNLAEDGLERCVEAAAPIGFTRPALELKLLPSERDQLFGEFPSAAPRSLMAASTCS